MRNCILCESERIQVVDTLSAQQLIIDWRNAFDIDITSELNGYTRIHRYHCLDCDLQFFPPELAGSAHLYSQLQDFEWYYIPHKWEHDAAAEDILPGDRVLEIGCGFGEFVEWLSCEKNANALGVELNANAVEKAQSLNRSVIRQSLEEMVDREKGAFDVVCSFQVLEHIANPRDFLTRSLQLLKSGGKLILCVPNADSFLKYQYNLLDMPPHHITRWLPVCISNLSDLFDVKLSRLLSEPLAEYHIDGYLNAHMDRIRSRRLRALLANSYTKHWLRRGLQYTSIRHLLRGQSIYACITKN